MQERSAQGVAAADPEHDAKLRNLKGLELFLVMRAGLPVTGLGVVVSILYVWAAVATGAHTVLLGIPLMLAGAASAALGLRTRLREARHSRELTTQGYGPIFAGWALVLLGIILPLYVM